MIQRVFACAKVSKLNKSLLFKCLNTVGDEPPSIKQQEADDFMIKPTTKKEVKIDPKYRLKSAALYDKYVESREKPLISLDNHQVNYCWILERISIFLPYRKEYFEFYKNRYQGVKKSGYMLDLPKQLIIEKGDYMFEEYEKKNPENIPSHETVTQGQTTYYRQNSRYWRYTDPDIKDEDERSVQTYSSDNVFFIVKNQKDEWVFPQRPIAQKQTHQDFFRTFAQQLFSGQAFPNIHFNSKKPIYCTKKKVENMPKGEGIKTFYFSGNSMSGIPVFPTNQFKDYKWVTKPQMAKYFSDEYHQKLIKLIRFEF